VTLNATKADSSATIARHKKTPATKKWRALIGSELAQQITDFTSCRIKNAALHNNHAALQPVSTGTK